MKKFFSKIKGFFSRHLPTKRRLIQLYSALLFNCYAKGYVTGEIFKGISKNVCTPGLNCYSCPGAVTSCPLGALQNAFSASGKRTPYYMLGIVMLYGVLLGRWICGWLCPFGFIQELLHKIKTPKLKKNIITHALSYLKYVILVFFVVVIPLLYMLKDFPLPGFCKYICPAGTFGGAIGLLINPNNSGTFGMLGPLFTWKFALMISILVGSIFIYRMFCRFLCPLGALYGLFNRIAIFGIKLEKKSCISCGRCVTTCKMDIRHVGDAECISCGECIPVCPTHAISWKGGNIILPPNEIDNKIEKLKALEPELDEAKAKEDITKRRKRRVKIITATVSVILILALAFSFVYYNFIYDQSVNYDDIMGDQPTEEGDAPIGNKVGNRAPSLDLDLVLGDGTLSVSELRGEVVVINFWGTWCGPCKAELSHFDELATEFEDSASFYIVHSVQTRNEAEEYIETNFSGSKMRWVYDVSFEGLTNDRYFTLLGGTDYYPRTVVLDKNGVITFAKDGAVTYEELKAEIEKAQNK